MNDSINSEGMVSKGKDTSGAHAVTSPLQFIQTRTSDAQENMDEVVSHDSDEERGDGDGMIQSIDDIGSTSNVGASSDSAEEHVSLNIPKAVDIRNGTNNISMMNDSLMMTPHHTSTSSPSEGLNSNRSGLMSPGDTIIPFKCFTPSLFSPGGQTVVPEEDESNSVNGIAQSNFEADREMNDSINSEGMVSKGKDTSGAHAVTSPLQFIQTRTSDAQENMDEVVSHDSDEERGDGDGMIQSIDDIGSTSNVGASSDSAEEHVSLNIPKAVDILNGTENVESITNDSLMTTDRPSPIPSCNDLVLDMAAMAITGQNRLQETNSLEPDDNSTKLSEQEAEWTDKGSGNESSDESSGTSESSFQVIILSDDESEEEPMSDKDEEELSYDEETSDEEDEELFDDEETSDEEDNEEELSSDDKETFEKEDEGREEEGSRIPSLGSPLGSKDTGNQSGLENEIESIIELNSDDSDDNFQISQRPNIRKHATPSKNVYVVIEDSDESDENDERDKSDRSNETSTDTNVMSPHLKHEIHSIPVRDLDDRDKENNKNGSLNSLSKGKSSLSDFVAMSPHLHHEKNSIALHDFDDRVKENNTICSLNSGSKVKSSSSNFKRERVYLTQKLFNQYDSKVFDNALKDVEVKWSARLLKTAGLTRLKNIKTPTEKLRVATIELSTKVIDEEVRLRQTLLHEMCHAAAWLVDGVHKPPHGPCFKKWSNIAMRQVKDVTVTTTHDYSISYKFAWVSTTEP